MDAGQGPKPRRATTHSCGQYLSMVVRFQQRPRSKLNLNLVKFRRIPGDAQRGGPTAFLQSSRVSTTAECLLLAKQDAWNRAVSNCTSHLVGLCHSRPGIIKHWTPGGGGGGFYQSPPPGGIQPNGPRRTHFVLLSPQSSNFWNLNFDHPNSGCPPRGGGGGIP